MPPGKATSWLFAQLRPTSLVFYSPALLVLLFLVHLGRSLSDLHLRPREIVVYNLRPSRRLLRCLLRCLCHGRRRNGRRRPPDRVGRRPGLAAERGGGILRGAYVENAQYFLWLCERSTTETA